MMGEGVLSCRQESGIHSLPKGDLTLQASSFTDSHFLFEWLFSQLWIIPLSLKIKHHFLINSSLIVHLSG